MSATHQPHRRRCNRCHELKDRNPKHPSYCAECSRIVDAEWQERTRERHAARVAAIRERTATEHLRLAHAALETARGDYEYTTDGVHGCRTLVDADALEWLVAQVEPLMSSVTKSESNGITS